MAFTLDGGVEIVRWVFERVVATLNAPSALAVAMLCLAVLAVAVLREGLAPFRSTRLVQGVLATAVIYLLNIVISPTVFLLLVPVQRGYDLLGVPHLPSSIWQHVPSFLLPAFVILCRDFVDYWNHRLMHLRWVWPVHAMHHSDPDVTALTTYRVHVLEAVLMRVTQIVALGWLGFPKGALGAAGALLLVHNAYVHVRVDWGHGPFRHWLASPRFHRWHHADVPELYGKNLANVFPFFDLLFGTYYNPGPCRAKMGVEGVPRNDVAQLMLFPFSEWGRMALAALGRGGPRREQAGS
jgi:sterol desaturase/sphingolipid hydroxylase (fatty acid hydroxylase superfamily)